MRLSLEMPEEVAMVGSAVYMGGEDYPTIELALYRTSFYPGQSDGRLTGEMAFADFTVRLFFPSSGCGVIIKDGLMNYAEPGLLNFCGMRASIIEGGPEEWLIVVWSDKAPTDLSKVDLSRVIRCARGLAMAFT